MKEAIVPLLTLGKSCCALCRANSAACCLGLSSLFCGAAGAVAGGAGVVDAAVDAVFAADTVVASAGDCCCVFAVLGVDTGTSAWATTVAVSARPCCAECCNTGSARAAATASCHAVTSSAPATPVVCKLSGVAGITGGKRDVAGKRLCPC